jgi:redox-sensitive bicupin YhaK (pirin superfamily)
MSLRPVKRLIKSKPTLEGAGVHLRRTFGFGNTTDFDPFLLFDDFRNDVPEDVQAGEEGIRFLLVSGKPIEEPVAWYGPIVMNTQEELRQAFEELDRGTFLKADGR